MPDIKIGKVLSFSSEDLVHVANNILSNDTSKKWKCRTAGEKSANLVLQLEEAAVISGIDIGNEHSSYVEVLVNRSSSNDDFKVLLVMSSFMSPLESRQSSNVNRVRMFTHDDLMKPENDQKWDLVKIVCTQPFNRHVQYGLSFIKFHTPGNDEGKQKVSHIGRFALRPESPNNIAIGSLFAKKKELQEDKPLTAAAAIRTASLSPHSLASNSKKIKLPQTPQSTSNDTEVPNVSRKRDEIFYSKEDEEPNDRIDLLIEQVKLEKTKLEKQLEEEETKRKIEKEKQEKKVTLKVAKPSKEEEAKQLTKPVKHHGNLDVKPSSSKGGAEVSKRKLNSSESMPKKRVKKQPMKPFHELLNGVVIVISGIQNPDRTNIRSMATSMGAKYKADWDNTCTHLICAFPNTPKFNQVKGRGKIVTKMWITDCHNKRKRLPWRRYALDQKDKAKNESEEEIFEEIEEASAISDDEHRDAKSGSDTEDEIERINALQQGKNNDEDSAEEAKKVTNKNGLVKNNAHKTSVDKNGSSEAQNIYDCSTDEDSNVSSTDIEYPVLPNFFEDQIFYVDSNLEARERKMLIKYIAVSNGTITTSLTGSIHFVISTKEHKQDLDDIPSEATVVNPNFVYACVNSKKMISPNGYTI